MGALWTEAADGSGVVMDVRQLQDGTLVILTQPTSTHYVLSYSTDHATLNTITSWTGSGSGRYGLAVDATGNIFLTAIDSTIGTLSNGIQAQAFVKGTGYTWTAKGWMTAVNPFPTYGISIMAAPHWANTGGGTSGAGHLVIGARLFSGGSYQDYLAAVDAGVLLAGSGTPYVGAHSAGSSNASGSSILPVVSTDGFGGTAGMSIFIGVPSNGIFAWSIQASGAITVGPQIALPTMYSSDAAQWVWLVSGSWALVYDTSSSPSLTIATYSSSGQTGAPVAQPAVTGWTTPGEGYWAAFRDPQVPNRVQVLAWGPTIGQVTRLGCSVSPISWDTAPVTETTGFGNASTSGAQYPLSCVRQPAALAVDYQARTASATPTYLLNGAVSQPELSVNVPTLVSPTNGTYEDVTAGVALQWEFNPADGSAQAGFCIRYKVTGAASYLYWNAATGAGQSTPIYNTGSSQSYTLPAGALSDGQNYNWSISTLSSTRIESGFAADFTLVAAQGPAVAVNAPTGTVTATSYPVVTWVDTLGAGLAQTYYQVRVFSAAQQSIPGFDPATSPATWDSGVVTSSATSATIATPLPDASGWYAYVQVTQTGGQTSAWSYTTFTVATPTPAPAVLTATATTDATTGLPLIAVAVQATDNLLSADDADYEGSLGTWGNTTNCALARATVSPNHGSYDMSMTASSAATMSASTATGTSGYGVVAGKQYTAMSSLRAGSTARNVSVGIAWYSSTGTHLSTSTGTAVADSSTGWTPAHVTATAPTGAAYAAIVVTVTSPASGEVHYVDTNGIRPGTDTTWYRGGLNGLTQLMLMRSDGLYVRFASATTPTTVPWPGQAVTINDAEVTPAVDYTYTAYVSASLGAGADIVSPVSAATSPAALSTVEWWEFDPTDISTAVAAQATAFNPQVTEQSAAHVVMGQQTPNVVANAMGATDGAATFKTFDAPTYAGLTALLLSQKTVFVSSPFGDSYYVRFGPQSGGMSGGSGNKTKDSQLHPSTAAAPVHETSVTFVAQPRPTV